MTVESQVLEELIGLRTSVSGIDGCLVATSDGLLVAHTLPEPEPSQLAALVSTLAGLARHAVQLTGRGDLFDAAVRGSSGYLVVYAVGEGAVLGVLGRADVNVALLQLRTKPVVHRLARLAAGFTHFTPGPPGSVPRSAAPRRPPGPRKA